MKKQSEMKVIVAHPGRQHSFQLATALKQDGMLFKYITSVYNRPKSFTNFLTKIFRGDTLKKISARRCDKIADSDVVQFNEIFVIITLFLNRIPMLHIFAEEWNRIVESSFYKKVMKYALRHKVDAIVVYNGYAKKHFEILSNTNIVKIIDVSIAHRLSLRDVFEKEINASGLPVIKRDHFSYWNERMINNDIEGCRRADYFLAPSQFVKNSLTTYDILSNKIKLVPYGVDIEKFDITREKGITGPLKIIYVGVVAYRKGIHRLLNEITKFDKADIEIYLAGSYYASSDLYKKYKDYDNIKYLGFVTRDRLNSIYNEAHIFILPSFAEGMAMVGLEALACGLPLVCTTNTGVNDVIRDGFNGFVYEPDDMEQLRKIILWFMSNRDAIQEMGENSRETAQNYTWTHYHSNVATAIQQCVIERCNDTL